MTALPVSLLVVAKAPVPGLAKTRLAGVIGAEAAADIAAAALLDTLDAVAAAPIADRVIALTGDLDRACRRDEIASRISDFRVIAQRGDSFAQRLVCAHADADAGLPVLQIGMDTPQVDAALLAACANTLLGATAVIGPASDGGWWAIGVAHAELAEVLAGVPMSRPDTGARTVEALRGRGAEPVLLTELADVDTVADLDTVRARCAPGSRFARAAAAVGV